MLVAETRTRFTRLQENIALKDAYKDTYSAYIANKNRHWKLIRQAK